MKDLVNRIKVLSEKLGGDFLLTTREVSEFVLYPTPFTESFLRRIYRHGGPYTNAYKSLGLNISPYKVDELLVTLDGKLYKNLRIEEQFLYEKIGKKYRSSGNEIFLDDAEMEFWNIPKRLFYKYRKRKAITNIATFISEKDARVNDLKISNVETSIENDIDKEYFIILMNNIESLVDKFEDLFEIKIVESWLLNDAEEVLEPEEQLIQAPGLLGKRSLFGRSIEGIVNFKKGVIDKGSFDEKFGTRGYVDFEFASLRWHEVEGEGLWENVDTENLNVREDHASKVYNEEVFSELSLKKQALLNDIHDLQVLSDNYKFELLKFLDVVRQKLVYIGNRLGLGDSIFFMEIEEVISLHYRSLGYFKDDIYERKIKYNERGRYSPPEVLTVRTNLDSIDPEPAKQYVTGTTVNPGNVTGKLIFVNDQSDVVLTDAIYVIPDTSTEYLEVLASAKGIIFQNGRLLGDGANLVRDFNVPAILTQRADKLLEFDGKVVKLQATDGKIIVDTDGN